MLTGRRQYFCTITTSPRQCRMAEALSVIGTPTRSSVTVVAEHRYRDLPFVRRRHYWRYRRRQVLVLSAFRRSRSGIAVPYKAR